MLELNYYSAMLLDMQCLQVLALRSNGLIKMPIGWHVYVRWYVYFLFYCMFVRLMHLIGQTDTHIPCTLCV
jgi:hypothetical protein